MRHSLACQELLVNQIEGSYATIKNLKRSRRTITALKCLVRMIKNLTKLKYKYAHQIRKSNVLDVTLFTTLWAWQNCIKFLVVYYNYVHQIRISHVYVCNMLDVTINVSRLSLDISIVENVSLVDEEINLTDVYVIYFTLLINIFLCIISV